MPETVIVHGNQASGPSQKVALTLKLAGVPFRYKHVDLDAGAHKAPAFVAMNRFGQVPVLQHGAVTLCQSPAILFYLADVLGALAGDDEKTRIEAKEWVLWDADALSAPIFRCRAHAMGMFKAAPEVIDFTARQAGAACKTLDGFLDGTPFLTGDAPTIGDIACYIPCHFAHEGNITLEKRPNVLAWMKRIEALPGYVAPYDLLPEHDMQG